MAVAVLVGAVGWLARDHGFEGAGELTAVAGVVAKGGTPLSPQNDMGNDDPVPLPRVPVDDAAPPWPRIEPRFRTLVLGLEMGTVALWRGDGWRSVDMAWLRLDMRLWRMRVALAGSDPTHRSRCAAMRSQAVSDRGVCVNGSFFSRLPLGLVVTDGEAVGRAAKGMSGYLVAPPDGSVELRFRPPRRGTRLDQAIQSFPALVIAGAIPRRIDPGEGAEGLIDVRARARRTLVGMDAERRLWIGVSHRFSRGLDFREAARLCRALGLVSALGLDGGGSSQLSVWTPESTLDIAGFDEVPVFLLFEPRDVTGGGKPALP